MIRKDEAPQGWFAVNIPSIREYTLSMMDQVRETEGKELTPARLKAAIDEDTHGEISIEECALIIEQTKAEQEA